MRSQDALNIPLQRDKGYGVIDKILASCTVEECGDLNDRRMQRGLGVLYLEVLADYPKN